VGDQQALSAYVRLQQAPAWDLPVLQFCPKPLGITAAASRPGSHVPGRLPSNEQDQPLKRTPRFPRLPATLWPAQSGWDRPSVLFYLTYTSSPRVCIQNVSLEVLSSALFGRSSPRLCPLRGSGELGSWPLLAIAAIFQLKLSRTEGIPCPHCPLRRGGTPHYRRQSQSALIARPQNSVAKWRSAYDVLVSTLGRGGGAPVSPLSMSGSMLCHMPPGSVCYCHKN